MHFLLCRVCNLTENKYLCTENIIYFGYVRNILSDTPISFGTYAGSSPQSVNGRNRLEAAFDRN